MKTRLKTEQFLFETFHSSCMNVTSGETKLTDMITTTILVNEQTSNAALSVFELCMENSSNRESKRLI